MTTLGCKIESISGTSVADQYQWPSLDTPLAVYSGMHYADNTGHPVVAEWGPQIAYEPPVQPMNPFLLVPATVNVSIEALLDDENFAKRLVSVLLKTLGKEAMRELLDEKVHVSRLTVGRKIAQE